LNVHFSRLFLDVIVMVVFLAVIVLEEVPAASEAANSEQSEGRSDDRRGEADCAASSHPHGNRARRRFGGKERVTLFLPLRIPLQNQTMVCKRAAELALTGLQP
jgi:hypothetical protein